MLLFPLRCLGASEQLHADRVNLLLVWEGEFTVAQKARFRQWLKAVVATANTLHGSPPRTKIRIILSAREGQSAVPFARVLRDGLQGIRFYVSPKASLQTLLADWTAYHEFSHLFIPYPGDRDLWFSEGLASYYQNVLQFRAGLLSEKAAWQKLFNGFERGESNAEYPMRNLSQLSDTLHETRAYMRVYWSGALYFLQADAALRSNKGKVTSLDDVLGKFTRCCLEKRPYNNARAIAAEFDRIAQTRLFVRLYERYVLSREMPDYQAVLRQLGVRVKDGEVRYLEKQGFWGAQTPQ